MKLRLTAVAALLSFGLFTSTALVAQEEGSESSGMNMDLDISYGLEVGSTWSSFAQNWDSFGDKQFGLAAGGYVKAQLFGPLGVSAELLYSQQGASNLNERFYYPDELTNNGDLQTWDIDIKMHKVAMPILINLTPPDMPGAGDVKPVLYVGAQVDYLVSAVAKEEKFLWLNGGDVLFLDGSSTNDITYSFNRWDVGAVIGAGLTFEGEKRGYGLDFKYKLGATNIHNGVFNYLNYTYTQNSLLVSFKIGL